MGEIIRIDNDYYVEFIARGLKYQKKAGPDRQAAELLLNEIEDKIAKGEALAIVREIHLSAFFDEFLISIQSEFSLPTVQRFNSTIDHFKGFLKSQNSAVELLSQATPKVIESYKNSLTKSLQASFPRNYAKRVNLTLLLLREVFEFGIKCGFIHDNPTLHVKLLPMPSRILLPTKRYQLAQSLLSQNVPLGKIIKLLGLSDAARVIYFAPLIPLSREDVYLI